MAAPALDTALVCPDMADYIAGRQAGAVGPFPEELSDLLPFPQVVTDSVLDGTITASSALLQQSMCNPTNSPSISTPTSTATLTLTTPTSTPTGLMPISMTPEPQTRTLPRALGPRRTRTSAECAASTPRSASTTKPAMWPVSAPTEASWYRSAWDAAPTPPVGGAPKRVPSVSISVSILASEGS